MNRRGLPIMISVLGVAACGLDDPGTEAPDPTSATAAALGAADDTCVWAPTVVVTPAMIPPTRGGAPVVLDVAVTNPNPAACAALDFQVDIVDNGLLSDPRPIPG